MQREGGQSPAYTEAGSEVEPGKWPQWWRKVTGRWSEDRRRLSGACWQKDRAESSRQQKRGRGVGPGRARKSTILNTRWA